MLKAIGTLALLKFAFCIVVTTFGLSVFLFSKKDKPWEGVFLKAFIVGGLVLKVVVCLLVYSLAPSWNSTSDPAVTYIVEARNVLHGELPYVNYPSSYSILFGPLLAIPVSIWNSVGAIALFNIMLEAVMLRLYLGGTEFPQNAHRWRIAFLYCYSPISIYWVDLIGYNGGIIQFGTFLALWLSERARPRWSGLIAGISFSATKLLAVLSWPAVLWFDQTSWWKRAVPVMLICAVTAALLPLGIDVLVPIKLEFNKSTSGNIWYIVSSLFPALRETRIFQFGHVVLFAAVFFPALIEYSQHQSKIGKTAWTFDAACAFAGFTNLLFMISSRKAYTFYLPMCFFTVLHATVGKNPGKRALLALALLGATTTLEDSVSAGSLGNPIWNLALPQAQLLLVLDSLIVSAYVYLLILCRKRYLSAASGFLP